MCNLKLTKKILKSKLLKAISSMLLPPPKKIDNEY